MSVRDKMDAGLLRAGTHRAQIKIAQGTVENFRLNAVDIAIFAAVFSLIADKSVSNTHSALKRILAESKEENIQKDEDQRNYIVSNKKIEKTGFKAEFSIDDGIIELIKAFKYLKKKGHSNI